MNKKRIAPLLQVAPLAILLLIFVGVPLAVLVTMSFWTSNGIKSDAGSLV